MTVLRTARLTLRRARPGDLAALHGVFSDPEAMRYWSTPPHPDLDTTLELVLRIAGRPEPLSYFVIDRDGQAFGCCGNYDGDEVGFILHRDHWRQGLMIEAMAAVLPYAWDTLALPRLTADVDPRNAASIALLTRLGFTETHRAARTFFIAGEWCDSVYFALQRP